MRGPSRAPWLLLALRTVLGGMEVRWCATSDPEQHKCSNMSKAFQEAGIQPSLLCVQGTSADHCVQLIAAQEADAITLDGGAVYEAGKEHGLKPVVGEVYDQEVGTSYYAVAVVRRSSHVTIDTLKGVKSCHTGINRTVGWNVPVGYLVESGRLSVMGCDVLKAVSDYFGGSCVPGAGETGYSESLCRLCRGDSSGEGVCDKSPQERYYDYSGAFRCLAEGAGDVAFVKHSTVLENTDESPSRKQTRTRSEKEENECPAHEEARRTMRSSAGQAWKWAPVHRPQDESDKGEFGKQAKSRDMLG
ncbi:melanotransferrin isoform X6 [Pongo pygmaeus]|uniref:melanotransferrin isoform X6 n=1 Tax=Pongo pygmaeus TaxID=9600 RepID=UPI0023E15AD8|nr:melanotransferrin isoform X3 [Pongo pygmaeus]